MPFHAIMFGVLCAIIAPRSAAPFFFCHRITYSHQFVTHILHWLQEKLCFFSTKKVQLLIQQTVLCIHFLLAD